VEWIKGEKPEKSEHIGLIGSPRYLVRFHSDQLNTNRWLGDRWLKTPCKGNPITHYMLLEEIQ